MADSPESIRPVSAASDEKIVISWQKSLAGLGTALSFAVAAVFIRGGLEALPSPLLGVTIGMIVTTIAYAGLLLFQRRPLRRASLSRDVVVFQLLAAVFVALATWARWIALNMAPVAVVLTLGRLNVPVVILLSPFLVGHHLERVTVRVWVGSALIIIGSLILNFYS
jgi:uncharacterized membrane protein